MNLLLTGFAVSNVFDGVLDLDSGGSKTVSLYRQTCMQHGYSDKWLE